MLHKLRTGSLSELVDAARHAAAPEQQSVQIFPSRCSACISFLLIGIAMLFYCAAVICVVRGVWCAISGAGHLCLVTWIGSALPIASCIWAAAEQHMPQCSCSRARATTKVRRVSPAALPSLPSPGDMLICYRTRHNRSAEKISDNLGYSRATVAQFADLLLSGSLQLDIEICADIIPPGPIPAVSAGWVALDSFIDIEHINMTQAGAQTSSSQRAAERDSIITRLRIELFRHQPFDVPVTLHIYDWNGRHAWPCMTLLNILLTYTVGVGIFHTGIEVLGREYSFARGEVARSVACRYRHQTLGGVIRYEPCDTKHHLPHAHRQSFLLGIVQMSQQDWDQELLQFRKEWSSGSYNLVLRNCNHFTAAVAQTLRLNNCPRWPNRLACWIYSAVQLSSCCMVSCRCRVPSSARRFGT